MLDAIVTHRLEMCSDTEEKKGSGSHNYKNSQLITLKFLELTRQDEEDA